MLADELKKLSKSEKLLLINDLWDEIAQDSDDIDIPESHLRLLDERYEAYLENPDKGKSWEEFKRELKGKKWITG